MNSRIRSILEIIGAFFVDDFYNRLYSTARTIYNSKEGDEHSLTSIYVSQVHLYGKLVDKYYTTVINKLQNYFQKHTNNNVISLAQMRDEIIKTYLPTDVVNSVPNSRKDALLRHLIIKIVKDFAIIVTKNHNLKLIIDNRKLDNSGRALQDEIINKVLIPLREDFYQEFMSKSIKGKSYSNEKVSVEIVNRIRDEKNALQKKVQLQEEQLKKLKAILVKAKEQLMAKNAQPKQVSTEHTMQSTYMPYKKPTPEQEQKAPEFLEDKEQNPEQENTSEKDDASDEGSNSIETSMIGANDFSYSDNEN